MKKLLSISCVLACTSSAWAESGRPIVKGSIDQTTYIRIIDSTDGTPETGVVAATAGLDLEYVRLGAAPADLTEADLAATDSAHSDGGLKHVGHGEYRVDVPDAACATGVNEVLVQGTATGMIVLPTRHALVNFDIYDADPNVDVAKWLGTAAATPTVAGVPEIDVTHWNGTAIATPDTAGYPKVTIKDGTGTGEIDTASGIALADVSKWLGTAAATPTVAGVPEIDLTHWNGTAIATPDTAGYPRVTIKDGTGTGEIDSGSGKVIASSVDALGTQAKTDVNAEVLDVLNTDTFVEPGQGTPAATTTLAAKISYIYKFLRNKVTQSATEHKVFADDAATVDQKATVSDDGTTFTRGEIATGP